MCEKGETNSECCLSPLDSARFIMERARQCLNRFSAFRKIGYSSKTIDLFLIEFDLKHRLKYRFGLQ